MTIISKPLTNPSMNLTLTLTRLPDRPGIWLARRARPAHSCYMRWTGLKLVALSPPSGFTYAELVEMDRIIKQSRPR